MKFSLRELRARHNLTQKQVANDLGISFQTYNAWEKDISGVAVSKVQAVADYFGVPLGQISFTKSLEILQVIERRTHEWT
jgi:transcriptional regulator with XRE-family HTH domain